MSTSESIEESDSIDTNIYMEFLEIVMSYGYTPIYPNNLEMLEQLYWHVSEVVATHFNPPLPSLSPP